MVSTKHFPLSRWKSGVLAALLAGALLAPAPAPAQQPPTKNQMSEATSTELGKVRPLTDAKNWDAALVLIDAQYGKVDPNTYDAAVLMQVKSQILLQKNELAKTIEPLERCLKLADTHGYFDEPTRTQMVYFLAQLFYQEGASSKIPEVTNSYLQKSESLMQRFVQSSKKPTMDATLFYASLLFNRAQTGKDNKADPEILKRALEQADIALRLSTRPRDNIYQLKLACIMQLGRNAEVTEILELLVKMKPENKTFWQQLAATYLNLAAETKDEQVAYNYQVRAILTMERAQALGTMNSLKENFNLIGIYFNIQQYEKAIELLDAGLRGGKIENDQKNWELLYYSYLQIKREFKAVEVLKEAAKLFPKSGQLEYLIAQTYNSLSKPEEAVTHLQACIAKGGSDKPQMAYLYLAYIAYELKKFDIALEAANNALKFPDGVKEGTTLKKAVEDALLEREVKKKSM